MLAQKQYSYKTYRFFIFLNYVKRSIFLKYLKSLVFYLTIMGDVLLF